MGMFKSADPQKSAQAALAAATTKLADLEVRLRLAETRVIECGDKVASLARDAAPDDKLDTAEAALIAARQRVVSLTIALDDIRKDVSAHEATLAQIADRQTREESAKTVDEWIDEWQSAAKLFDRGCLAIEAISALTSPTVPEAGGTQHFAQDARQQLPAATAMIVACLKNYKTGLLAGGGKPSLSMPQAPAPKLAIVPPPPPVPMTNIFILQNLKFVNAEGATVCLGRNKRADLPAKLAEQALAEHKALPLSDPRCRALEYGATPYVPDEASCVWIGPPAKAKPAPKSTAAPITSSHVFEPSAYGRQAPKTFIVPIEPTEIVRTGTRAMPEGDEQ